VWNAAECQQYPAWLSMHVFKVGVIGGKMKLIGNTLVRGCPL
jgi:hypothetical protein